MRRPSLGMPRAALVGSAIIAVNLAMVVAAPVLAPYGEAAMVGDVWASPGPDHWFGLDNLGRDLLSRLIHGSRATILIGLAITLMSFSIGMSAGFVAVIRGGWVEALLTWLVDFIMAIPNLIFVLIVLTLMGTSIPVLICTIAAYDWAKVYRTTRNASLGVMAMDFIEVARLRGEGNWWLMRRELLPNIMVPLAAEFGLRFSFSFLFIASLSFLGLGIQPPQADWGGMVRENAQAIGLGIVAPLFPAAAIALLAVGVNLVTDWLLLDGEREP